MTLTSHENCSCHPKTPRTVTKKAKKNCCPGQMVTIRVSVRHSNRKIRHVPICPMKHTPTSMLMYISGKLSICNPIKALYDLKGKKIHLPQQLNHDQHYVGRTNCRDQAGCCDKHLRTGTVTSITSNTTELPLPIVQVSRSDFGTAEICSEPSTSVICERHPRRPRLPSYYRSQMELLESNVSETQLEPVICTPTPHRVSNRPKHYKKKPIHCPTRHHKYRKHHKHPTKHCVPSIFNTAFHESHPQHHKRKHHKHHHPSILNTAFHESYPSIHKHHLSSIHDTTFHASHPPHHKHLNLLPSYKSKPAKVTIRKSPRHHHHGPKCKHT